MASVVVYMTKRMLKNIFLLWTALFLESIFNYIFTRDSSCSPIEFIKLNEWESHTGPKFLLLIINQSVFIFINYTTYKSGQRVNAFLKHNLNKLYFCRKLDPIPTQCMKLNQNYFIFEVKLGLVSNLLHLTSKQPMLIDLKKCFYMRKTCTPGFKPNKYFHLDQNIQVAVVLWSKRSALMNGAITWLARNACR